MPDNLSGRDGSGAPFTRRTRFLLSAHYFVNLVANAAGTIVNPATSEKQDSLNTAVGAVGDAAWSGAGSSSVVAALKAIYAKLAGGSTAAVTKTDSSTTSATVLAANAARKMATFYNTDANACLLKFGATAAAASFTVKIPQDGYFEMPLPVYTGRIDAIWEADGSGSLLVTEY